jgi:hypothetical protein
MVVERAHESRSTVPVAPSHASYVVITVGRAGRVSFGDDREAAILYACKEARRMGVHVLLRTPHGYDMVDCS